MSFPSIEQHRASLECERILDECEAIGKGGSLRRPIDANLGNGVSFSCAPIATFPTIAQRCVVTVRIPDDSRWTFIETADRAEILDIAQDAIDEARAHA